MKKLRDWLIAQDLHFLVDVFEREKIDWDTLHLLSPDDLKELGLPLGLRAKLRAALQSLRNQRDATDTPDALLSSSEISVPVVTGERRQLTVLFCDIVGSTELARSLDPEVLQLIFRQYEHCCATCIARFEGYVFQFLGDCVVAFFGYPLAHENEVERAIRAGLQIIASLKEWEFPEIGHLSVRVGIATGIVVVAPGGKGAVGETMNLAARLQSIAQPGDVVISEQVHRLAGGRFVFEDLKEQKLKGFSSPVHAYRILAILEAESRFEAATLHGLTPLIGRDQEIAMLLEVWANVAQGYGQVLVISGEPGIGKSRLLKTLVDRVRAQQALAMSFQCSPYHINSTLWPILKYFERELKLTSDETSESRLAKLEELLVGQYGRPLKDLGYIAALLSIPNGERLIDASITPERRKKETLRSIADLFESATTQSAMLMLFEDVHWADPTTLELLTLLITRSADVPLLILLSHRPDFRIDWHIKDHVKEFELTRLTRAQSAGMVARLAGEKNLPEPLLEQILSRTDGVPLYVEELAKAVLESSLLIEQGQSYDYRIDAEAVAIPATLRGLLMARLDRSDEVKQIAQIGAAIGRVFSHEMLSAVSSKTQDELEVLLSQLIDLGVVTRCDTLGEVEYTFRHALLQEVAYDSLLKNFRQVLHGRIAHVIEERFPIIKIKEPEVLARHLTAAGLAEEAMSQWLEAGELAIKRMALFEAISHLNQGLRLVSKVSESSKRDRLELSLRRKLGIAWMAAKGWPSPEARECLFPALSLTPAAVSSLEVLPVYWGLMSNTLSQGRVLESLQWAQEFLAMGLDSGDSMIMITGHLMMTVCTFWLGQLKICQKHTEDVMALYDPILHRPIADVINHDPLTGAGVYRAQVSWMLGYPDRAVAECDAKDAHAKKRGHVFDLGFALCAGADVFEYRGEPDAQRRRVEATERLARENSLNVLCEMIVPLRLGASLVRAGQPEQGVMLLRNALKLRESRGGLGGSNPYLNALMAEGMALEGEVSAALLVIEQQIENIERPGWGERSHYAEILRLKGWMLELRNDFDAAEACYRSSLEWARIQHARSWELRTATKLAQLQQQLGRTAEAHELLSPIYSWFTEGFQTRDLINAKRVLEQLR